LFPRTASCFVGTNGSSIVSLRILGLGGTEEIGRGKKNFFPPPSQLSRSKKNSFPSLTSVQEQNRETFPHRAGLSQSVATSPYWHHPSLTCLRHPSPTGTTPPSPAGVAPPYRCRPSLLVLPIQLALPDLPTLPLPVGAVSTSYRCCPSLPTPCHLPAGTGLPASVTPVPSAASPTCQCRSSSRHLHSSRRPFSLLYGLKNSSCLSFSICIICCILLQ
jgi:hypothetical protein